MPVVPDGPGPPKRLEHYIGQTSLVVVIVAVLGVVVFLVVRRRRDHRAARTIQPETD